MFDGMAEALKALNASRLKSLSRVKQCDVKRNRRKAKKDRQSELNYGLSNIRHITHMVRKHLNHLVKEK